MENKNFYEDAVGEEFVAKKVIAKARETISSLKDKIKNLNFNETWLGQKVEKMHQVAPDVAKFLRESLLRILSLTKKIGGKIVSWGAKFIQFILDMLADNPNIGIGILIVGILSYALNHIPVIGQALSGIVIPLAAVYFIGLPVIQSVIHEASFKRKISVFAKN